MSAKKKRVKAKKYTAVIIGAGRIGTGFDAPKSPQVLTHAHAYHRHPSTELIGIADLDERQARLAGARWRAPWFDDTEDMLATVRPDIVSVCVPTEYHAETVRLAARYRPQLIICEKPATDSVADTKALRSQLNRLRIPVLINHSRRFDAQIADVRERLQRGTYGRVLSASAIYTKGIRHNGSHIVDLARWLFGEVKEAHVLQRRIDWKKEDPTVDAHLRLERCPSFFLIGGDERRYSIVEFDILCERGRIRMADFGAPGVTIQIPRNDPHYKGYRSLPWPKVSSVAAGGGPLVLLINEAVRYVKQGGELRCDLSDALRTQEVCERLARQAR